MKKYAILLLPVMLAACGGSGIEMTNSSMEDVEKAVKGKVALEPGQWDTTPTLVKFETKGVDPQQTQMMKQMFEMMMRPISECLTPELATARLSQVLGNSGAGARGCRYEKFSLKGEDFDWTIKCESQGRPSMTTHGKGKLTKTMVDAGLEIMAPAPSGTGSMQVEMKISAKQNGACKPGQASAPPAFMPQGGEGQKGAATASPSPAGASPAQH